MNTKLNYRNLYGRKADLSEVSKPVKVEEKKNALANIDINNYASKNSIYKRKVNGEISLLKVFDHNRILIYSALPLILLCMKNASISSTRPLDS